jgi:hypothetical protein
VNSVPLTLRSNSLSKCSSVRLASGANSPTPALDQDIDVALCLDGFVKPIEVLQLGEVAPHPCDIVTDRLDGLVEFLLAAAGYEDVGAFIDKPLRYGKTYSRGAAANHGQLSLQLAHHGQSFDRIGAP